MSIAGRPPFHPLTSPGTVRLRLSTLAAAVLAAAAALPRPAPGQQPAAASDSARPAASASPSKSLGAVRILVTVGSAAEERVRTAQLRGQAPVDGFLLRSPSSLTPWAGRPNAAVVAPEIRGTWNSRIPYSVNDGAMWAGRGANVLAVAGAVFEAGPLRLVVAPEVTWSANQSFDSLTPVRWDSLPQPVFQPPWQTGRNAVDMPVRFGPDAFTRIYPGQSSLTLRAGAVAIGAATENQWWGPGVRNAIVFTNQAAGVPHLFLRTARPLATPLGPLEAKWVAGALRASAWTAAPREDGWRSLSAVGLTLRPGGGGLALGVARAVYARADGAGDALGAGADAFTRWGGAGDTLQARPFEQITSLFGRWVFPREGAEIYAEWARYRLPGSLRDVLESPEHTQGWVLGGQWLRPAGAGAVRLQAELTYLERDPTYASQPIGSWYASAAVPQGYTQEGQVIGASAGPGGSAQWAAVDWMRGLGRAGVFLGRNRWANDAYYDQPGSQISRYRGHDVTLFGGVRAAWAMGPLIVGADYTLGKRFNYLFQNTSTSVLEIDGKAVDVVNHTLELRLSPRPARGTQ